MGVKIVYSAPVSVTDSLGEPVKDPRILSALAGICCLEGTVLEHLDTKLSGQVELGGGYLRLFLKGKRLELQIEIESPRKLEKSELSDLRESLDGQVSDGIGEGAFDFVATATSLSITTFPELDGKKGSLVQAAGDAWRPESVKAEVAANRRRCEEAAAAATTLEQEKEEARGKRKTAKPDPKKLFKLIQQGHAYPRPIAIEQELIAEIAALGGDLGFIESGCLPYERLNDSILLQLLLDSKLNPNLHDRDGHSLLWLAAGNPECVALLLDHGADVNFRNSEVYEATALMDAARLGVIETVKLLLARGADPSLKTRFGQTALDEARRNQHWGDPSATVKILEDAMNRT